LLCASILLFPVLVLAQRLLGLRRTLWFLNRLTPAVATASSTDNQCVRLAHSVSRIVRIVGARIPLKSSCLEQSVFLHWLLARQGIVTDIRIGIRNRDGGFQAHAWVEHLGQALNEGEDVSLRFVPFPRRELATVVDGK
jgi:hypothetical protein